MKNRILSFTILSALLLMTKPFCAYAQNPKPFVIPEVQEWKGAEGMMSLGSSAAIVASNGAENVAKAFAQDLDGFRKEQAAAIEVANREQNERIESLSKEQAVKIKELSDAHSAEMELLNETISTLKTKLKIAYIIAGSTAVITVAHLILNFWVF